jgi:hypothetical protein
MKQFGLISSAAFALLMASTFIIQTSQSGGDAGPSMLVRGPTHLGSPGSRESEVTAELSDVWNSPTGRRWLHGQPSHWRAMLLNR